VFCLPSSLALKLLLSRKLTHFVRREILMHCSSVLVVVRFWILSFNNSSPMKKIDDLARQFSDPIVVPHKRNMYNNPGQSFSILDDLGCIIMHGIACSGLVDCINKIFNNLFGNSSFVCPCYQLLFSLRWNSPQHIGLPKYRSKINIFFITVTN